VTELNKKVGTVLRAIGQISNSEGFSRTLACALALGNYCNGGTSRGQAWGIKLSSLAKFGQVKSVVNAKVTLLHYLVEMVGDLGGSEACVALAGTACCARRAPLSIRRVLTFSLPPSLPPSQVRLVRRHCRYRRDHTDSARHAPPRLQQNQHGAEEGAEGS